MKTPNLLVAFIVGLVLSAGLSASDTRYVGEDRSEEHTSELQSQPW